MNKKLIMILALCVAAVMILTACGQSTGTPTKEETTAEETTAEETAAEETTEEETTVAEEAQKETSESAQEDAADDAGADVTEEIAEVAEEVKEEANAAKDEAVEDVEAAAEDVSENVEAAADDVADTVEAAADDVAETVKAAAEDNAEVVAEDVEKIIEDIEETVEDIAGSADDQTTLETQDPEEASSISDFIESLGESGLQDIFDLIADAMDTYANEGRPSQAGNIVRSLGNLINTIITGDRIDDDSSELLMDLILDEDSFSQLSDGMIFDMYEASRNELVERGVIK